MKQFNLLSTIILFLFQGVQAQNTFITLGVGYLPNRPNTEVWCTSCQRFPSTTGTDYWIESLTKPGYSLYLGIGKTLQLKENWSIQGIWQLQQENYLVDQKTQLLERSETAELFTAQASEITIQNTTWQTSLMVERAFSVSDRKWSAFGGGYISFQIEDWAIYNSTKTTYFTDIETAEVFDPACHCTQTMVVSKKALSQPQAETFDSEGDAAGVRSVRYGVQGGISFPLLSSKEGELRGQLMVTQDLTSNYDAINRSNFHQTSIKAGLMFSPKNIQPTFVRKSTKRTLSSGIYGGVASHNFTFISMDAGWLSSKHFGLDFSARYDVFLEPDKSVFIGPIWRLGNSRFFLKAGGEFFWFINDEAPDETSFHIYTGGKYILPFSKSLGLQLNAGFYMNRHIYMMSSASFGVGFVFLPRGG